MNFTNDQIDLELLPKADDIQYVPVEEKYKKVLYGEYILLWGIPLLVSIAAAIFIPEQRVILLTAALFFLILMFVMLFSVNRIYNFLGYALRENDVCLRRGLFFRKYIIVPFNRIQHITVEQGVLSRAFGLASFEVFSAAGNENNFVLKGISRERANEIKQFILQKIKTDDTN